MFFIRKSGLLILSALFFTSSIFAQTKDTTSLGSINGSVKDSVLNYFLPSATISIYSIGNNGLVTYTMTNARGEFSIANLALTQEFLLKISFIGYETFSQVIKMTKSQRRIELGNINLKRRLDSDEDTVLITPPPVRMHGDTLEFSAAAFSLDKNAVAEDLLKNLPGVIVWGDGTITVNGKQISKLLVDGKPFFGGETNIAIQNIPKNAIDRVQVYQEFINPTNPFDSISTINLKLRKNMHSGYFGVLSAGKGTTSRYTADANSSIFSPQSQVGIALQSNNVNKTGNDINTLLRNNTFKGVSANVEYQPDFNLQGSNQSTSGGLFYAHDLIPTYNDYKQNRLTLNAFINNNQNTTQKNTQTVTAIGNDSTLEQSSRNNININSDAIMLNSRYNILRNNDSLIIEAAYNSKNVDLKSLQDNSTSNSSLLAISTDNEIDTNKNKTDIYFLKAVYGHNGFVNSGIHKLTNWGWTYSISSETGNLIRHFQTVFTDNLFQGGNLSYNRKYNEKINRVSQSLSTQIGDFSSWLFGNSRVLSRFHLVVGNDLAVKFERGNNFIRDKDTLSNSYLKNQYLTNVSNYQNVSEQPHLNINRSFINGLTNRFQTEFNINVDIRTQLYFQMFSSSHSFQNFNSSYHKFIPTANISYSNFHYSDFMDRYNLSFSLTSGYPTPDQTRPLVDSAAIYSVRAGNRALKEFDKYEFLLQFRHDSYSSKNTFFFGANLKIGFLKNYFGDSVIIDQSGKYTYYTVNLNRNKFAEINLFLDKAILFGANQILFNMSSTSSTFSNPGFIGYKIIGNSAYNLSQIFINSDSLSLNYSYKNILAITLLENLFIYKSSQRGISNTGFKNIQTLTRFGMGINLTKKLSVNTNVSYNYSIYSTSTVNRFTIWNAFMAYRFLNGNNLEVKISALDLLNQNRGVINSGNNYSFTYGTINMLHQYFMVNIIYFPRKFGNKTSAKNNNTH